MRNFPKEQLTFGEFLEQVKENALGAFENQDYQFEMLVDKLDLARDLSRNPLFDTMFVLQNLQSQNVPSQNPQQAAVAPYEFENTIAKFDLTLNSYESHQGIQFTLEYRTKLFKREMIERLAGHFVNILNQISENPDQKLMEVDILSGKEKEQLIYGFNNTEQEYSSNITIHQLFEEQVQKTPRQLALVFNDQKLTYLELNQKANQLARLLQQKGVKSEQIVGIMMERSLEMVISMIAVLKAGAAYLPIDPSYPEARIEYMITDSNTGILLTQDKLSDDLNFTGEWIVVDELDLSSYVNTNLSIEHHSTDLAYVIYTSGSTGKPKGVMVEHKGIANIQEYSVESFGINETDKILQFASSAFDASVWEIYLALLSGATLYLIENDRINDYRKFESYLNDNGITSVTLPPVYLNHLSVANIHSLKRVITGGSATNYELVTRWKDKVDYINAYGPTESTICATVWKAKKDGMVQKNIPIGMPIFNTKVYILDKNQKPLPVGVVGELCIGGAGLARGYLNKPDLTEERFVHNEFVGERIYRTGDLARWLVDGNIEFIGRMDNQVKIRGYRIELGEIEHQLLEHDKIQETVVIVKQDQTKSKYIVAYFVSKEKLPVAELKTYLSKNLPQYMIPSYFIQLDNLPISANGKIDHKALPETDSMIQAKEYIAPQNEIEEKLTLIWSEILGAKKIGITDNFFELGGHSLKATSLVTRIYKEFEVEIPLSQIFNNPTINQLAKYIQSAEKNIYSSIKAIEVKDGLDAYYPVSSAQKRVYILNQLERMNTSYNMPGALGIRGDFDKKRLNDAFRALIQRHDAFRTSFEMIDGEVVQRIHQEVGFEINYFDQKGEIRIY